MLEGNAQSGGEVFQAVARLRKLAPGAARNSCGVQPRAVEMRQPCVLAGSQRCSSIEGHVTCDDLMGNEWQYLWIDLRPGWRRSHHAFINAMHGGVDWVKVVIWIDQRAPGLVKFPTSEYCNSYLTNTREVGGGCFDIDNREIHFSHPGQNCPVRIERLLAKARIFSVR